jgi:hypothetical protein
MINYSLTNKNMKRLLMIVVPICLASFVSAQIPAEQTMKVEEEQVPVSVRTALTKDFSMTPDQGIWMVHIVRTQQSGKTLTEAEWYSFNRRIDKKQKIEVRYSPTGELLSVKGIEKNNAERARK